MTLRDQLIKRHEAQSTDLAVIGQLLKNESRELTGDELKRIEEMLSANAVSIANLVGMINEKERSDRNVKTSEAEMLWQSFENAESHVPTKAVVFVIIRDENPDEHFVSIELEQPNRVVDSAYKLTEEEYLSVRKKWDIENETSPTYRHGGSDIKITAKIPTRIVSDGIVLPDIPKHWVSIYMR